jgi:hypothetical protein
MCPDDLCVLPGGHVGTEEGWHILGTTPWDNPIRVTKRSVMFLHPDGGDDPIVLVREGAAVARRLWPDTFPHC